MGSRQAALPLEPLRACAVRRAENPDLTVVEFADMLGTSDRAVQRWQENGGLVPWITADRVACKLGVGPYHVWGEEWLNLFAEKDAKVSDEEIEKALDRIGEVLDERRRREAEAQQEEAA